MRPDAFEGVFPNQGAPAPGPGAYPGKPPAWAAGAHRVALRDASWRGGLLGRKSSPARAASPAVILWVPGRLPGLNDLLGAKSTQRGAWNAYNSLKQQWSGQIKTLCALKRIDSVGPGCFTFMFVEPTRRRDPDNLVSGGVKLIFDALVSAEVLSGDGWDQVLGFCGYWIHEKDRAGCLVHHDPWHTPSKDQMLVELEKELGR